MCDVKKKVLIKIVQHAVCKRLLKCYKKKIDKTSYGISRVYKEINCDIMIL